MHESENCDSAPAAHDTRQPAISQARQTMITTFHTVFTLVYLPSPTSLYRKIDAKQTLGTCAPPSRAARTAAERRHSGGCDRARCGHGCIAAPAAPTTHRLAPATHRPEPRGRRRGGSGRGERGGRGACGGRGHIAAPVVPPTHRLSPTVPSRAGGGGAAVAATGRTQATASPPQLHCRRACDQPSRAARASAG